MRPLRSATLFPAFLVLLAAGCGDVSGPGAGSPLEGLVLAVPEDSSGNPTPPPTGTAAPGYFRGTVRGPNAPGQGGDTLSTSPRIAGVTVTAYPATSNGSGGLQLGPSAGSTSTNAQGEFTFPTIPGGGYAVTFIPPTGSDHVGVWVVTQVHATSHEFPWWVTLPRR